MFFPESPSRLEIVEAQYAGARWWFRAFVMKIQPHEGRLKVAVIGEDGNYKKDALVLKRNTRKLQ